MKKIHLFLLAAFSLAIFNSCQEIIEEENIQEATTLNSFIPPEDEDANQYIENDEKYSKAEVTEEFLAEIAAFYANQSEAVDDRAHCTEVCDGLGNMPVFCETFDDVNTGSVAQNSIYFEKWVPSAQNDGQVVRNSNSNNILRIDRRLQREGSLNEEDDILVLGTENQGCYTLRFEMLIHNCRTAYFSIEKQLRQEVLIDFTFHKFGKGTINLPNGTTTDFTYPVGRWFEVELHFNINNLPFNPMPPFNNIMIPNENTLMASINGREVAEVSTEETLFTYTPVTSNNNIQGVNFYPLFRSSKFYIDNICFAFLGDPAVNPNGGD